MYILIYIYIWFRIQSINIYQTLETISDLYATFICWKKPV